MDPLGCCLTFPTERLYRCAVRVLVYLGRTRSLGITYSRHAPNASTLRARADSNWRTTRSTSGYHIDLGGACIAHCCRRQGCISMSTTEAELVALADCAIELLYIRMLLEFVGFRVSGAVLVETDSKGARHELNWPHSCSIGAANVPIINAMHSQSIECTPLLRRQDDIVGRGRATIALLHHHKSAILHCWHDWIVHDQHVVHSHWSNGIHRRRAEQLVAGQALGRGSNVDANCRPS